MQILTVFHFDDIPQVLLQAITFKKFWKDNKHWTLIVEDPDPICLEAAEKVKLFMNDWNIDIIVPDSSLEISGWHRQQIFKMWYASKSRDDWVLIVDAKNFLIRPTDQRSFVTGNKVKHIPLFQKNDFTISAHKEAAKILNIQNEISFSSCMTPCVWKTSEIKSLVSYLGINLNSWPINNATEFSLYYLWTFKKIKYREKQFVTGFWEQIEDYELAEEISIEATKKSKFLFWTHHRYVYDIKLRNLTYKVLQNAGIKKNSLELWNERYDSLFELKESSIKQSRALWKTLLDN